MQSTFLTVGIACLIAAIVGGGLKAFGIEIPLLKSVPRQLLLGGFGAVLLILSFVVMPAKQNRTQPRDVYTPPHSVPTPSPGPEPAPVPHPPKFEPGFLREQFEAYYAAGDPEINELIVLEIREKLMDLAVANGYSAEHINNANIRELGRIARKLGAL